MGSVPRFWWVNQGSTYPLQRAGGYLFASSGSGSGREVPSWQALKEMSPGDVVFHYATGELRALGTVSAAAAMSSHPEGEEEGAERNVDQGYKVLVSYTDIDPVIKLHELPIELRDPSKGPFTKGDKRQGEPQQGYAFPLTNAFVLEFRKQFVDRLPYDPW